MKKLFFAAAMLLSTGAMAQEVNVTMAEATPFEFTTSESYVSIYLGDETRAANIADDNYIYIGPDGDNGRNLWVWNNTYDFPDTPDLNSFGIPGEYMSLEVKDVGWSGLGYNIAAANPVNLSFIDSNWAFHIAVKTQYKGALMFNLTDGTGTEAHLVFGESGDTYDEHPAIANFPRDGEWYNIDIPMACLEDQFEFTFAGAASYADKNYFVVCCGGVEGTVVSYDAVFFHGPKVDAGLINQTGEAGIGATLSGGLQSASAKTYDLCGRVASGKGIRIVDGKIRILKN